MKIGFIGQGWIGKNYADDFEQRGYEIVRYALEEPYRQNKEAIPDCDITFIAVPTPTTPEGFDFSIVTEAVSLVGEGNVAVIKSTLLPGTTESIQKKFPKTFVLHSPEFLVEKTAAYDAANPTRNIIGIPIDDDNYQEKAKSVLVVLPKAPYEKVMSAKEAELTKYAGNCYLYNKVVFMNLLYDLVTEVGGDWSVVREALIHDKRIGESHTEPVHESGRGAGGHCFVKDFEAFRRMYTEKVEDAEGSHLLDALKDKNNKLLIDSNKDLDILRGVYGDKFN